jgi:hypothetical protein
MSKQFAIIGAGAYGHYENIRSKTPKRMGMFGKISLHENMKRTMNDIHIAPRKPLPYKYE